jgi:predicted regulator of Ras-like GTPase activity (Roadblock/LC7/MglB family)
MAWQRLIDDFANIEGVDATVLITRDGLPLAASNGISRDDVDHLAAIASGLHGLARNAASRFGGVGAGVKQTIVEMHSSVGATRFLLVGMAGNGGLLAVLTTLNAELGDVASAMAGLARQIGSAVLTSRERPPAGSNGAPGNANGVPVPGSRELPEQ